ncbi:MAG: DNA polymerase III subunit gamma/tau [Oscillospiraceae bacterium]|nr:DNA polymerase III subunit gamma/tau [Oscillospiraceae bacterium]
MYQALYRKWRPQTFDDVVGQEHVTDTLKAQVRSGRVSHAYLFTGTRGTGKTTCAKILSRAANCEHPVDGNPCNCCPSCLGIASGTILDVEEIDAASNNGVDNIRSLREEAVFTPAQSRKRVYIVDEVHMLSTPAFNALLKILEEPPEHLIFILATTEIRKVPATIRSRCQRFNFRRLPAESIADRLLYIAEQEGYELTEQAADLLSRLADGSMRDGVSLLDQCAGGGPIDVDAVQAAIGLAGAEEISGVYKGIIRRDTKLCLETFHRLYMEGKDPAGILDELLSLARDVLLIKAMERQGEKLLSGRYSKSEISGFARDLGPARAMDIVKTLQDTIGEMWRLSDKCTAAELCFIKLCEPAAASDIDALAVRLEELERKLAGAVLRPVSEAEQSDSKAEQEADADIIRAEAAEEARSDEVPWEEASEDDQPWEETPVEKAPMEKAHEGDSPVKESPPAAARAETGPEEKTVPEAAAEERPNEQNEDIASAVLDILRTKLGNPAASFLDSKFTELELGEGIIQLSYKQPFLKEMLDKPEVTVAIGDAAEQLTGRRYNVRVAAFGTALDRPAERRDDLRLFGDLVKFN